MPESLCLNGGECTMNGVDYACKCATGWTGKNCQTKESMHLLIIAIYRKNQQQQQQ